MNAKEIEQLFWQLYNSKNETDVDKLIRSKSHIFNQSNWSPLGGIPNNIGVVKNQQANPVAALVEKLTNSIDAILMRRCYEESINPKSANAPRTIENAIAAFFPEHKNWDLQTPRNLRAESVQIIADGYRDNTANTSIVIYDDGEGQHPEDFENTFLSLIRDNKREIPFVQGKYNMGGSGAITFCGKKRYQLIASKRHDRTGSFGFTLIREHPLSSEEAWRFDEPWYEYLKIDGRIASFEIQTLDLGLRNRKFCTGTIIKLYSYDVKGNRHLGRDMGRSINEFLFEPALPITIVESAERYPNPKAHTPRVIFGLKRRLDNSNYLEDTFSEEITDRRMGKLKVTVYVFKALVEGKTRKNTRETVRDEFFKNRMQVLFSLNGQVHGHYTAEFISRTLKFSLLKDYALINVDCTDMKPEFRRELFMASRDRLKQGKESSYLRKKLGDSLRSGRLRDIFKARKDLAGHDSADSEDLLKQIAEDLPFDKTMRDLIKQTLELDEPGDKQKPKPPKPPQPPVSVDLKRYPSFFRVKSKSKDGSPVISIPVGGSRTVRFESDVADNYFDRTDDPGGLNIAILTYTPNDATGGNQKGTVNSISDILSVKKTSPKDGNIKIVFEPTEDLQVGDEIELRADLLSSAEPDGAMPVIFWISIIEPKKAEKPKPPPKEEILGLPQPVKVFARVVGQSKVITWDDLPEGIIMDHSVVMHPLVDEKDKLEKIYINMDSRVLKNFKPMGQNPSEEQRELADRQYISRVYYHTLFLYLITRNRKYIVRQLNGHDNYEDVDLTEYLKDVFDNNYTDFLLSFETSALMEGLG